MAEQKNPGENIFSVLRRAFSTDVIIRNTGSKKQLTVIDPGHIQTVGAIQTNSLIDRFHKVYTTSTAYGVNLNLAQNYQSSRVQIYADYDAMDTDAIISSALDIISDECTLENDNGRILSITSADENIQNELENLFYSVLNLEFNLWSWIRNMCKYGDFYLKMEIAEDFGVYNVIPFSAYNIVRQEGFNPENPNEVRFKFDPNAALGSVTGFTSAYNNQDPGIWFDNYEIAHFRLIGDVNYLPYGRSYLENSRKLFKQYTLIEDAMLIHRITRAPERRIFYVNIGSIPPHEVDNYIQKMIQRMKKAPLMDPQTGQYNLKYNQQNLLEDFIIPMRGNDTTTKIDTAKGLDYNAIDDVVYFREKLFAALKIPKAFMGYEKDLCVVPETKIPLLNGKTKTVAELILDFENGIDNYTYSIDESTKNIVPGKILWAGYTRKNADLVRVTLDNDKFIECTPDHNFMTRGGQWIQAQNLQEGQALMPIYFEETIKGTNKGYTTVYNPSDGKYKEVHRLVPEYYGSIERGLGKVVHHIDFDKKNNYPSNLDCSMNFKEHREYHQKLSYKTINSSENIAKRINDKNWIEASKTGGKKGGLVSGKKLGIWVKTNGPANKFRSAIKCLVCNSEFHQLYESRKFCNMACRDFYYRTNKDKYNDHLRKSKDINFKGLVEIASNCSSYKELVSESKISRHVIFSYFKNNNIDKYYFLERYMPKALSNTQFIRNYKKEQYVYANHKVKSVEFLNYKKDTCDLHIEDHHNFATDSGVIIHNSGKATLAAEDIRFARTIERLQRIICSELKKIAIVHLLSKGYEDSSVANFDIKLTKPSIIYEQERIAMFKEKVDLATQAMESGILPREHMWKNIFKISEDEFFELDDMIIEDQKRKFRYKQIAEEGNDPAETGQAFGTPHQLASLYGGKMDGSLDVPAGYDFKNSDEPLKVPGRPQKYKSTYGTDESPFGRDSLGKKEINSKTKVSFRGGPLNNEGTMGVYLQNKASLDLMKSKIGRKTTMYTQPNLLNEENIREDLD
jgi:intein/homing endonuclease